MFIEIAEGVIELKDDGTYTKHPVRFHNVKGKVFKEDLATKDMQPVPPSVLFTVNEATGEIEGEQKGFVLDHQFNDPIYPTEGKKYFKVNEIDLPIDFKEQASIEGQDGQFTMVISYKVKAGKLVKK